RLAGTDASCRNRWRGVSWLVRARGRRERETDMSHSGFTRDVTVTINGVAHSAEVEHRLTLVDFLRHTLHLTGTHVGCEHGVCGACTVLVDGISMRSCLMLAVQASGKSLTTVESLAVEG